MSKAPPKYIIGLTGNIGTGKSVVRRMLQELGALTIDADALSHRAIARGTPGYEAVQRAFGPRVLNVDGEIDRAKLGAAAFGDTSALQKLEAIIHPLVRQAIGRLIQRAIQSVVVIEAIKLLEGNLAEWCDSIWVTDAPASAQLERLTSTRGMSREQAVLRINAQGSQADKVRAADVVIRNLGSFADLRGEVERAWRETVPAQAWSQAYVEKQASAGKVNVTRAEPEDYGRLAGWINRHSSGSDTLFREEGMIGSGPTLLLLHLNGEVVGWASWSVEDLVACTADLHFEPAVEAQNAVGELMQAVESWSAELQCEVSLLFLSAEFEGQTVLWKTLGYEPRAPEMLARQAWKDAALNCRHGEDMLFFKNLSTDPIFGALGSSVLEPPKPVVRAGDATDS